MGSFRSPVPGMTSPATSTRVAAVRAGVVATAFALRRREGVHHGSALWPDASDREAIAAVCSEMLTHGPCRYRDAAVR